MGRLSATHTLQRPHHLVEPMKLSTKSLLELCREYFILVQNNGASCLYFNVMQIFSLVCTILNGYLTVL